MKTTPHTAMLMAAGLGTRMRPLTDHLPKPMLQVAGRPLIDRLLDQLVTAGVSRAVVNVHWQADKLEDHLSHRDDIKIQISDERQQLLETGGGLAKARDLLGDDPVFVLNTDAFWDPASPGPLEKLADVFDPETMDECLLLARTDNCLGYHGSGDFRFVPEPGRPAAPIRRRGERSATDWAYAGVRIMKPSLYDAEPAEPFSANRVWDKILKANRLFGTALDAYWLHVGDPDALKAAEARLASVQTG